MSLTTCLKKAGDALAAEHRVAIMARTDALRAGGLKPSQAALQAVTEYQQDVQAKIAALEDANLQQDIEPLQASAPFNGQAQAGDSEAIRKAKADLMAGLGDLASLLSKNTRSNITPEQEQQLLPILTKVFDAAFRLGYLKFQEAAKFVLDQIRAALGDEAADAITLDHLQGSYIGMAGKYKEQGASTKKEVVSVEDLAEIRDYTPPEADNSQQESDDVPGADTDLERDRGDADAADAPVGGTVPVEGPADGPQAPVGETGSRRNGRPDEPGVSDGRAAAGREPGDQQVPRGDGPAQPSFFDAGAGDGERSDDPGFAGVPPETVAAGAVEAAAVRGLDDAGKRSRQRAAEPVPVVLGDLANIRETLPYLLEGQQEDVLKAEQTFAKPNGYGMLFTNGTGTGKTFTGLGVVKRFQRRGITDQLIVVPDEKIMNDWVESGVPLGLTITPLKDTKDKGRGITITTYANLGQNIELVDRDWQHVVADEAHMLMQAEDAKESLALDALRALTWHPRGAWRRFDMLHAEDLALKESLEKRIGSNNKIMNLDDTMDVQVESLRRENEKLYAELNPLKAKLKAAQDALTAEYEQRKLGRRPRATFLSATPFAYVPTVDWAEGYLFDYAEDYDDSRQGYYNAPNPREQFFIRHFGYRMRTGKLNKPDAKVDTGLMERQFNGWLKKRGVLSSRMLDVAADYDRRFVLVDSQIGNAIDRAIDWIRERRAEFDEAERARLKAAPEAEEQFNGYGLVQAEMDDYLFGRLGHLNRRYLLEAIKAKEVIPHIREHLALGRKLVVFHDFNKGGAVNPFAFREQSMIEITPDTSDEDREIQERANLMRVAYNAAAAHFHREFPELGGDLMAELMSPIARFTRDVPGVLVVNGTEKTKDNLARYKQFNDDARGPSVLLVQSDKNKGWSGHDTTGKHQRVLFNLGLPTQPTKSIQQEGRIYRTGQVSNAMFRYLNTGTNWERWAFAQTIAERASTAENLGMGELARALKDAYISGFEESDDYRAGHEGEGKGGKERDRLANNAISEYDRAKSFYWGTEKKNARTKAREGQDYFATPEPVGLKMVQWSDTRGGEDSLEPSGGHGAIARWMGEKVNKTAIEPSNSLGSRLAMVFDGKIISGRFEDHHPANKYDTIVMNPPFGTAGRTAIDHVAQAATHLREWGRIVALIPDGPSAGEKFDKWFYEEADRPAKPIANHPTLGPIYRGDTLTIGFAGSKQTLVVDQVDGPVAGPQFVRAAGMPKDRGINMVAVDAIKATGKRTEKYRPGEDLHLVAEIKLPGVTFERAATSVRTRVLVIDKLPKGAEPVRGPHIDLSDIDAIDELFDRLEDIEVPARQKEEQPEIPEIAKKGPVTLEELQELESVAKDKAKVYLGQAITAFQANDFGEAYAQAYAAERGWDYQPFRTQMAKLLPRLDKMVREAFKTKNAAPAEDLEAAATAAGFNVMDYLTRKGKTLRVVEAPHLTRDQAAEIEGAAWKPSGAKGYYVKVQNVPAMLAKYPPPAPALRRGNADPAQQRDEHLERVNQVVDAITQAWAAPPAVRVVWDLQDPVVDERIRAEDARQRRGGAEGSPLAVFDRGTVYIVASAADSDMDVARSLFHEALGHAGLRAAFGDALRPMLGQLAALNRQAVEAKAAEYGLDMANDADRRRAAEEVLAELAETRPESSWVQRAIAAIRTWLREKMPDLFGGMELSDAEIVRTFIVPARRAIERWWTGAKVGGVPVFQRRSGTTDSMPADSNAPGQGAAQGANSGNSSADPRLADTKIINDSGAPLRLYHGTKAAFDSFDLEADRRGVGGIWFTDSKNYAYDMSRGDWSGRKTGPGGRIFSVYLAAKNPKEFDVLAEGRKFADEIGEDAPENSQAALDLLSGGMGWDAVVGDLVDQAKKQGHDALIIRNFADDRLVDSTAYVVFDANNIVVERVEANDQPAPDSGGAMFQRQRPPQHAPEQRRSEPGWTIPGDSRFDDFAYKFQDKQIDLRRARDAIKTERRGLEDRWDAYLQEELFHGRAAKRTQDFVANELDPLMRDMALRGISIDDLDHYLHARHAEEANKLIAERNKRDDEGQTDIDGNVIESPLQDGGSGMLTADARAYLEGLDPALRGRLEAVAAKVDKILATTRRLYASYGLESQATVDAWSKMFKHYVPLMREDHDGGMGIGQGFSIKGREAKHRTGSTAKVVDILANIAMQRERAIVRGEKNRVAVAMAGLVKLNPAPDFWTIDKIPTERVLNEATGKVEERQVPGFKNRPNVMVAKIVDAEGGVQERAIVFNEANERAMRMVTALKNLDAAQLEGAIGVAAKITRYFAAINTQYNPVFGFVNLTRDVQGAALNLASTPLTEHRAAVVKNIVPALRAIYRAERGKDTANAEMARLWDELQLEGGMTGFRDLYRTSEDRADAMRNAMDPTSWMNTTMGRYFTAGGALKVPMATVQKGAGKLFDWLSDYNQAMEGATRLAAYKVALEQGLSKQQAASIAKNLTVNFNRKGQAGMQMGALYAFFNASVQGTTRMGQVLFDTNGGTSLTLTKAGKRIIAGGLLLGMLQALVLAAAGFDDDEPPKFVRERALIIPTGWLTGKKDYISVPMPLGWHVLPNIGRMAAEYAMSGFKDPGKRVARLLGTLADAFNPVGNAGLSLQTVAPTAIDPLVALAENRDWTGKPIAKPSFDPVVPGPALAKDTASSPSKWISEAINWMSGGTKHVAGAISPTPDQIDYLLGQVTGGVGRELGKAEQTIMAGVTGESLAPHKIPLVGRFYGNADGPSGQATKFYENLNRIAEHEAQIKGLMKDQGQAKTPAERSELKAEIEAYKADHPDWSVVGLANGMERLVRELRNQKRALLKADASRDRIKEVEAKITAEMTRLNEAVAKALAQEKVVAD